MNADWRRMRTSDKRTFEDKKNADFRARLVKEHNYTKEVEQPRSHSDAHTATVFIRNLQERNAPVRDQGLLFWEKDGIINRSAQYQPFYFDLGLETADENTSFE